MQQQEPMFTVNCPQCQKQVLWDELYPWRPFCSKRCQLIDLGEWAAEEKPIAGAPELSHEEQWDEDHYS